MTQRKAVLVMGAGDATGGAIARRFAREGYVACVARRNAEKLEPLVQAIRDQGGEALACGCDARQEQQVIDLFARIEGEVGALEAVIFNVGANVWFPITETTERVYRKVWEMAAFGGFLTGREAARVMLPRQPVAAVHALAYPLGGHFHIPHGLSNALVLPEVIRFNAPAAAGLYAELAPLLLGDRLRPGDRDALTVQLIDELAQLSPRNGLPSRLRDAGVDEAMLPRLAADAMLQQRLLVNNPREVGEADALAIYRAAY